MNAVRKAMTLALAAVALGALPAGAQDPDRRELERRLRELREEMRDLERQLARERRDYRFDVRVPRVLTLATSRAQLGVFVQTRADEETDAIGAVLQSVVPDSPADDAGLRAGDIITSFNGEPLAGEYRDADPDESAPAAKLIDMVRELEPGDDISLEYVRDGQSYSTIATLEEPEDMATAFRYRFGDEPEVDVRVVPRMGAVSPGPIDLLRVGEGGVISFFAGPWSDMELVNLNDDLGSYFGVDEGLLVIQSPNGAGIDLRSGDVILAIDGREPRSPSRALRILRSYEPGETANLEIMRNRERLTVSIEIPEGNEWSSDGGVVIRRR